MTDPNEIELKLRCERRGMMRRTTSLPWCVRCSRGHRPHLSGSRRPPERPLDVEHQCAAPRLFLSDSGSEATAREAAKRVEDLWFEYGQTEADKIDPETLSARQVNLYALAKGRA